MNCRPLSNFLGCSYAKPRPYVILGRLVSYLLDILIMKTVGSEAVLNHCANFHQRYTTQASYHGKAKQIYKLGVYLIFWICIGMGIPLSQVCGKVWALVVA